MVQSGEIRDGPEVLEHGPCGIELENSSLLVSERLVGAREQDPDARAQIWRPRSAPRDARSPQGADGRFGLVRGQGDRALSVARHGAEHLGAELARDALEFRRLVTG